MISFAYQVGYAPDSATLHGHPGPVNASLQAALLSSASGLTGVLVGGWQNARRARKTAQQEADAAARAKLEQQGRELIQAVLALSVAANTHHVLWDSKSAQARRLLLALIQGGVGLALSERRGWQAVWDGYDRLVGPAVEVSREARRATEKLQKPVDRLVAAAPALLTHQNRDLAAAAAFLTKAAIEHPRGGAEVDSAREAFEKALQAALEPPRPRRRPSLGRRRSAAELPSSE